MAVLVNDMAAINIDQRLLANSVVAQAGQQLVALSNGCICCTIREDLVREIKRLADQQVSQPLTADATAGAAAVAASAFLYGSHST